MVAIGGVRVITQEEIDKVDVVARVGTLMLGAACAASDVVYTSLKVAQKLGLRHVSVHLTYSDLQVSYRPPETVAHQVSHTISLRRFDYGRQTRVKQLADEIVAGRLDHVQAARDLEWIRSYRGPYPEKLVHMSSGLMAAAAALLFGGNLLVATLAFVSAMVVDYVAEMGERRWGLPVFFQQVLAGLVGIGASIVATKLDAAANASAVVIAVIIVMLAGMTSTAAINDAITGWHLTGVGRISEALVNTLGLVIGVRLGIFIASAIGVDLAISEKVRQIGVDSRAWLWILACIMMGVSLSLYAQTPKRGLPFVVVLTPATYMLYVAALDLGVAPAWATAIGAMFAALVGTLLSKLTTVTVDAFAVCAVIPMMPGSVIYRALWAMSDKPSLAVEYGLAAVGTAIAIAAGLTTGQYIGVALVRRLDRTYAAVMPVFHKPYASLRERRERMRRRRNPQAALKSLPMPAWLKPHDR